MQLDLDELAAKSAVACWHGPEGTASKEIQTADGFEMATLVRFLNYWMLARSNPLNNRDALLKFLNEHAIPALKAIDPENTPSRHTYAVIEELSERAQATNTTRGRPTSLLSKLALLMRPLVFIPYDTRVRAALQIAGNGVPDHNYTAYMVAVLSEKPGFDQTLKNKNLSVTSLGASGMSQALFEMRALDKRLMLTGGFSPTLLMPGPGSSSK